MIEGTKVYTTDEVELMIELTEYKRNVQRVRRFEMMDDIRDEQVEWICRNTWPATWNWMLLGEACLTIAGWIAGWGPIVLGAFVLCLMMTVCLKLLWR